MTLFHFAIIVSCSVYFRRFSVKILLTFLLLSSTILQSSVKEQIGRASFYHDKFQGRKTSSGEVYEKHDFTAAHRTYPFNTLVLVTNKLNHRSVVVRINDRGPFHKSRMIDLSKAAAMKARMDRAYTPCPNGEGCRSLKSSLQVNSPALIRS